MRLPILLLALCTTAHAQPLLYEARIQNAGGALGQPTVTFALYADPEGGLPLWESASHAIPPDGHLIARLDDGLPSRLDASYFRAPRWLEATVHASEQAQPLGPRQRIGAVPDALRAPGEPTPGLTPQHPAASCAAARDAGLDRDGVYWITPPGRADAIELWCDQTTDGGGLALLYNSVLAVDTQYFWRIERADRLARRGRPTPRANFYDGSLYVHPPGVDYGTYEFIDVIEDLRGHQVITLRGRARTFDADRMNPVDPVCVDSAGNWCQEHFAGDWRALGQGIAGFNPDLASSQHYGDAPLMSLGADRLDDAVAIDANDRRGPHVDTALLTALGLSNDGTTFSRVRRIARLVRW